MNCEVNISSLPEALAEKLADDLIAMITESSTGKKNFNIALSGGNTAKLLFPVLAVRLKNSVSLDHVHIFWVDERCVPPGDRESNFGMTKTTLLDKIKIPLNNIHRIKGEEDPVREAERYSVVIKTHTSQKRGLPFFDLILLGLGEDGHTASIFPGNDGSFTSGNICEVTIHPVSGQKRITITGRVINNAENIYFLVTGPNKAEIVSAIIDRKIIQDYPASHVKSVIGVTKWYIDADAARLIGNKEK